jgi:hypothetical protein
VAVEVCVKDEAAEIDLTKEQKEPLVTTLGKFTVQTAANGGHTLTLEPAVAKELMTNCTIKVLDDKGQSTLMSFSLVEGRTSWTIPGRISTRNVALVRITLPPTTRKAVLPVLLRDYKLPDD